VRRAQKPATETGSPDAGSFRIIIIGMGLATFIAFPLAWVPWLRFPAALQLFAFVVGLVTVLGGSLLRRHCWKVLGTSFTGDVRAHAEQRIVTTGAYAVVRHPSYTAGILMNLGLGLALGSWGSALSLTVASVAVYIYRITVEERALLAVVGEPYREFIRTRRRLIPFIY